MAADSDAIKAQIIDAAMAVREVASPQWEAFVRAMALYSAAMAQEMVKSEPDRLVWAQGRAQGIAALSETLFKAPQLFNKRQMADEERRQTHARAARTG